METMDERLVHLQEAASPRGPRKTLVNMTAEQAKEFRGSAGLELLKMFPVVLWVDSHQTMHVCNYSAGSHRRERDKRERVVTDQSQRHHQALMFILK